MVSLTTLVELLQLEVDLQGPQYQKSVTGIGPLDKANEQQLSFLANSKYRAHLQHTRAAAVIVSKQDADHVPDHCTALVVNNPYLAYAQVSKLFQHQPSMYGIDPAAILHPEASVAEDVVIGAGAVIQRGVRLAAGVVVGSGTVIEEEAIIGEATRIAANVTILCRVEIGRDCKIQSGTVIGSDGFGYAPLAEGWQAIAQLGGVKIGNSVEIGANCTIDRGAIDDTVIEDNVIIDNLVQIAHNVTIGKGTAIAAQVGIAGSADVGAGCAFGGQAGVAGHIRIADRSHFAGQAMVTKGTQEAGSYSSGLPIAPTRQWRRTVSYVKRLESLYDRVKELEHKIDQRGHDDP